MTDLFLDDFPRYVTPVFVLVAVLAVLYRDHRKERP